MATETLRAIRPAPVVLDGERLLIRDLSVDGSMAVLAREVVADGRDLELIVRQAVEVGAAVLLHGTAKGTVDAVASEIGRLLTALTEKSGRIEAVQSAQARGTAKGVAFEAMLAPALDACFAAHQDVVEVTGATTGIADAKVGDFVVTVNPRDTGGSDRRIVFEAKDRSRLSMTKALAELDAAMIKPGRPGRRSRLRCPRSGSTGREVSSGSARSANHRGLGPDGRGEQPHTGNLLAARADARYRRGTRRADA